MKSIVCLADFHTGSRTAIFPDNFITDDGNNLSKARNRGQKLLMKYFEDFTMKCSKYKPSTVILLGDLVNGTNRNAFGEGQLTPDIDEQRKAFVQLILPLVKLPSVESVHLTTGSGYHESLDSNITKAIADDLKGEGVNAIFEGYNLTLNIEDFTIYGQHECPITLYAGTMMEKEMREQLIANALKRTGRKYDLDIRAHLHKFSYEELRNIRCLVLPCWQGFTPINGMSKSPWRWYPDIGGVLLRIDGSEIAINKLLYPEIPPELFKR